MALRFGWIGASRRGALRAKVTACLQAWLADWHVAHEGMAPHVEESPIVPYSPDEAFVLQVGRDSCTVIVATSRDELFRLGNRLAGIPEGVATLSQEVARSSLEDLAQRIGQWLGEDDVAEHGQGAWPLCLTREELGAVGLAFDVGGVTVGLAFSRHAVDATCPPKPVATGPVLQGRGEAVGAAPLRLTAELEFGAISMRELADLKVGEVLVGECPLDTPVRLRVPGGSPLGHALMGRIGNRLAVAVTQHSISQENT